MAKITKTDQEWREQLSPQQYDVTRRKGTERPFTGEYHACKDGGIYHCVCCGGGLFSSEDKFDSGTGWPSYTKPVEWEAVRQEEDNGFLMKRVEVLCAACDAHLGHVFPDGPPPGGLRFCINSAALTLERAGEREDQD